MMLALAALFVAGCTEITISSMHGLALPAVLCALAVSTLISEDLACIGAGILVSRGDLAFLPATLACFVGIYVGDMLLYIAGRFAGRAALGKAPLKWFLSESGVTAARQFFDRHGFKVVFTTRVLPGSCTATYFAAGLAKTPLPKLAILFFIAVAMWTPLLVGLAVVIGQPMLKFFESYKFWALPSAILVVLVLLIILKIVIPLFSWKGRRLLLCRWRRLTHYEFWPTSVFYLGMLPTAVWLILRHRSLSFLTATNPGIDHSGVVLESKINILRGLDASPEFVARWHPLANGAPHEERLNAIESFMAEQKLTWPVVLKPDIGERGKGVAIIRSLEEAGDYLQRCPDDIIVQEFVAGPEFGIFYVRHPAEEKGRIFSITRKQLLHITGDGQRTLEDLILAHDRAVSMSRFFFKKHAERLSDIVPDGEVFALAELGTHARGSVFLEGDDLITPQLTNVIENISSKFDGFYFGRYDIRAASEESIKRGTGFKILELNGLTSESTNMYDPKHSLRFAYRTTRQLWNIAARIAAENITRGAKVTSLRELFSLFREFRQRGVFEA